MSRGQQEGEKEEQGKEQLEEEEQEEQQQQQKKQQESTPPPPLPTPLPTAPFLSRKLKTILGQRHVSLVGLLEKGDLVRACVESGEEGSEGAREGGDGRGDPVQRDDRGRKEGGREGGTGRSEGGGDGRPQSGEGGRGRGRRVRGEEGEGGVGVLVQVLIDRLKLYVLGESGVLKTKTEKSKREQRLSL